MSSVRASVIPVGAGVLAGIITSIIVRVSTPHDSAPQPARIEPTVPAEQAPRFERPEVRDDGHAFDKLASRVRSLEQRTTTPDASGDFDPEQLAAKDEQKWSAQLDSHKQEVRDERWAARASTALTNDLSGLLPKTARLITVDCRTTTCAATIEWNSYAEAHDNVRRMAVGPFPSENCDRAIHAPLPQDPNVAYQNVMIFDCEGVRSGRAQETIQ